MPLESKIEELTKAVSKLTMILETANISLPMQALVPAATVGTPVQQPVVAAVIAPPGVEMPPPPTFMAPLTPSAVPFNDNQGLIKYIMASYEALGKERGAMIQDVLGQFGYKNVTDVQPQHYAELWQGVEALKS